MQLSKVAVGEIDRPDDKVIWHASNKTFVSIVVSSRRIVDTHGSLDALHVRKQTQTSDLKDGEAEGFSCESEKTSNLSNTTELGSPSTKISKKREVNERNLKDIETNKAKRSKRLTHNAVAQGQQ
jgi:hypothetical protein